MVNKYILYFMLFGFLGWIIENMYNKKSMCNPYVRMLSGGRCLFPFLLLYGIGGTIIVYVSDHVDNMAVRALIYAVVFNIIELIGGFVGEKVVCKSVDTCAEGKKMWDYSDNPNIGGYIDVKHTIYWAVLGLVAEVVYKGTKKYVS